MRKLRRPFALSLSVFLLLASCCALVSPVLAQSGEAGKTATTPSKGSPERKAILDAVRVRLQLKSQFKVYHLKLKGNWAYFHGGEVVEAGGGELQETDHDVKALLERKQIGGKPLWTVAELWTLPTEDKFPHNNFVARTRRRLKLSNTPADIFPADMWKVEAR
ncbi:MAG TPA: hypothetical protein VEZ40_08245 [Pyrinomonadaceae bacterium]|nr:hypothetical protein [Pyrinomonadaceae bacterium]